MSKKDKTQEGEFSGLQRATRTVEVADGVHSGGGSGRTIVKGAATESDQVSKQTSKFKNVISCITVP